MQKKQSFYRLPFARFDEEIDAVRYHDRFVAEVATPASIDWLRIIAKSPTADWVRLDRFTTDRTNQLFVTLCHLLGPVVELEPVGCPCAL
jgi:hypothetical protein